MRKTLLISFMIPVTFAALILSSNSQSATTNLIVTGLEFDKTRIAQNESINVSYRLKPEGMIHSCFNMGLWLNKDSKGKKIKTWGLPSNLCNDLKNGQTISQTIPIRIPDWGLGEYEIVILADTDNYLKEKLRSDNEIRKKFMVMPKKEALPDLKITDFTLAPPRPAEGERVKVKVQVYNSGSGPSGSYEVEWWANSNLKSPSCKWKVDNTAPKGGRVLECDFKGYPTRHPSIVSRVIVDPKNRLKESNKGNNLQTKQIQVVPKPTSNSSISGSVTGINIQCRVYLYGPDNLQQNRNSASINSPGQYRFTQLPRGKYKVRIGGQALEDTWVRVIPPERIITCTGTAVKNVNFELKR